MLQISTLHNIYYASFAHIMPLSPKKHLQLIVHLQQYATMRPHDLQLDFY